MFIRRHTLLLVLLSLAGLVSDLGHSFVHAQQATTTISGCEIVDHTDEERSAHPPYCLYVCEFDAAKGLMNLGIVAHQTPNLSPVVRFHLYLGRSPPSSFDLV